MRIVKITGLLIFLAGFFLFNAATFLAEYRLTAEVIREKITDGKKQELFREYSRGIVDKTFSSSHSFVSALQETFDAINRAQADRYKITEQEIDEIIRRSKGKFTTPTLDSVFRTSNEVAAFKNKALRQHVGELNQGPGSYFVLRPHTVCATASPIILAVYQTCSMFRLPASS